PPRRSGGISRTRGISLAGSGDAARSAWASAATHLDAPVGGEVDHLLGAVALGDHREGRGGIEGQGDGAVSMTERAGVAVGLEATVHVAVCDRSAETAPIEGELDAVDALDAAPED